MTGIKGIDLEKLLQHGSLFIQGTMSSEGMPKELLEAFDSYYKGNGMSVEILRKYYSYGEGLTIMPDEKFHRALFCPSYS